MTTIGLVENVIAKGVTGGALWNAPLRLGQAATGDRLPSLLRELLGRANGMLFNSYDDLMIHFFSLEEITAQATADSKGPWVHFADWSIMAHTWAVRPDGTEVVIDAGTRLLPVAESLEAFFKLYLQSSRDMWG